MRSILLLLGTLLLAVGGFVVYRFSQPPPTRMPGGKEQVATPVDVQGKAPRLGQISGGDRPWIRNIDRQGRLASRFRADEYLPQGGGRVHVIHPQAEFFQYPSGRDQRVQRIFIESRTGDMEVQQPSESSGPSASSGGSPSAFDKGSSGPPKRGRLKDDVHIRIFPDTYGPRQAEPSITLVTDNMTFDNETFEVSTAATTDKDGKLVSADEVPITVTGDYQFEGRGLKLRWNDLDSRLEFLEIAHGDYLTILHPGGTNGSGGPSLFGGAPTTAPAAGQNTATGAAGETTTAVAGAAAPALPAAPAAHAPAVRPGQPESAKASRHGPQPPYLATFDRDVRVSQGERGVGEKQLATADLMTIDFLTGQSKATTQPTTAPVSGPTVPDAAPQAASRAAPGAPPAGGTVAAIDAGASVPPAAPSTPAAGPATGPSTRPADLAEAVTVRWSGKLHVVPIDGATPTSLKPGESLVHLTGEQSPVHVTRDANDVRCARLDYRSPDGTVALYNSPAFPQVVLRQLAAAAPAPQTLPATGVDAGAAPQPDEAVIVTEAVDYSGADRVAVLHGNSEAQVQLKPDPSDPARPAAPSRPGVLDVKWQRLARIYFLDRAGAGRAGGAFAPAAKSGAPGAQQLTVDHAHFEGDVQVRHPQLSLDSKVLDAEFDPPAAPTTAPAAGAVARADAPADTAADVRAGVPTEGAPPTTRPAQPVKQANLRRLVATDAVTCEVTDEAGKKQNVECREMVMDTGVSPAGKLYPKKIDFDGGLNGDAHAFDPTQDIKAGHIAATFVPAVLTTMPATGPSTGHSTAPEAPAAPAADSAIASAGPATKPAGPATRSAELDTVTATDRVRVAGADGAMATADRLFVKMVDGSSHARLTGTPAAPGVPAAPARVVDAKKNVVVGPVITAEPKQNTAAVEGPGTMHLLRQETPRDAPRWIDVAFKTGATMDSASNLIDIRDAVSVVSTDPDGTVNTANGRHVRITLADKPPEAKAAGSGGAATGPSTGAAGPPPGAATRPGKADKAGAGDPTSMDAMKGKVVTGVTLEKSAVVKSGLTDLRGAVLREFELKSELVRYELGSTQPGAKGKIIVPVSGQMLVRDHRPPGAAGTAGTAGTAGAAAAPGTAGGAKTAGGDGAADPGQSRGATAFQWSKDLNYDEATYTAVLSGDVWIVHQDDDPRSEPARLRADRVVAVFEPRHNPAAKPVAAPGAPAGAAADPASQLQLKWMTATGNVSVTRAGSTLTAPRMDYDPATGWMTAVGAGRVPAAYADAEGVNSCTAQQIDWNARTWNVKFKDILTRTGRR